MNTWKGESDMELVLKIIGAFVLAFLIVFIAAVIFAYPLMWMINYIFSPEAIASVFGTPQISFWKSFWLQFFFYVAFKSHIEVKK